jgi:uncharacterized protein (TIGR00266 family)
MEYQIQGGNLPVVLCTLQAGDSMYTESGGMSWMTTNIGMETNMKGGLMKGLARKLAGESLFMTTYSCQQGQGLIAFSSSFPGEIRAIKLEAGQSLICQKRSFLAAESSVTLEMHFRKRLGAGLFGGEGFILQKITGPGMAFVEMDGSVIEYDLQAGQVLKVDTGHVAMFDPTVNFDIQMVKGFSNVLFGGEGLFLGTLTGPGKVWLQTMPFENLANQIIARVPSTSS